MDFDKVKFIRLVKANNCLYDRTHRYFKSVSKKRVVWRNIGSQMGIDGEECVRRWTNIRDRFSRESRRMTSLVNNGLTTERIWYLYDEMEFLRPHIIPRSIRQNLSFSLKPIDPQANHVEEDASSVEQEEDATCDYECSTEPFQFKDSTSVLDDQEMKEEDVDDFSIHDSQDVESSPKPENRIKLNESIEIHTIPATTNQPRIITRKRPKESSVDQDIISALQDFKEALSETGTQHQNPAVQGFGQMIVESICTMSERKQAIAMQKVTELVMNIKMQPETD